jgi:WhiB family redox-sensing transcriptional regulator
VAYQTRTQWGLDSDRADPWQARAACNGTDPEIFHPVGEPSDRQIELAFAFCRRCQVTELCREYSLTIHKSPADLHGVWGGLTQPALRRMLADRIRERQEILGATCRRCGVVGLKLDGRRLCADCFHIARRGRYLSKFYDHDPALVHEPLSAAETANRSPAACGFGHPYTELNTYISPEGKRSCRRCKNGRRSLQAKERVSS